MKKIIVTSLFIFITTTLIFADSITDMFDLAKKNYENNDIETSQSIIDSISSELSKKKLIKNSSEFEIVEFSRLYNFPSRY